MSLNMGILYGLAKPNCLKLLQIQIVLVLWIFILFKKKTKKVMDFVFSAMNIGILLISIGAGFLLLSVFLMALTCRYLIIWIYFVIFFFTWHRNKFASLKMYAI